MLLLPIFDLGDEDWRLATSTKTHHTAFLHLQATFLLIHFLPFHPRLFYPPFSRYSNIPRLNIIVLASVSYHYRRSIWSRRILRTVDQQYLHRPRAIITTPSFSTTPIFVIDPSTPRVTPPNFTVSCYISSFISPL